MTTTTITASDRAAVTRAAALLAGAAAVAATADAALLCLAASEQLRTLGVNPAPAPVRPDGVRQAIHRAQRHLGEMRPSVFGLTSVLNAAAHCRRALQLVT